MSRILVVDDDNVFLTLIKGVLEGAGYTTVILEDPGKALSLLANEEFDLVITDIAMPKHLSGFDLVKSIRRIPALSYLPIAMLTGSQNKDDVFKALECGANDFIVKPIDPKIFLAKVSGLLGKQNLSTPPPVEVQIQEEASCEFNTVVMSLSEQGLAMSSTIALPVGEVVKMKSLFFEKQGIGNFRMRITECLPMNGKPGKFELKAKFIDLNEGQLKKLSRWIDKSSR